MIEVKRGSVSVKVYQREKSGRKYFQIADYSEGKRRLRGFRDLKTAKEEAYRIADKIRSGDSEALRLTGSDRQAYVRSSEVLRSVKVPLEVASRNYAEACKMLGGDFVLEAARYFAQKNPLKRTAKPVHKLVDEFLSSKQQREGPNGLSERYLSDLAYRLKRFQEAFVCDIGSITSAQIEDFLNGLKLSARSYINHRRVIGTLFGYAVRRGYLPKDHDVMDHVERIRVSGGDIEIFSPSEMEKLLSAADSDFLPALVLGGFAGLRTSEIERLSWEDIQEGFIEVARGKTKTKTRRIVPVCENLQRWLELFKDRKGMVWPFGHNRLSNAQKSVIRKINEPGFRWKQNALRHSFISYRLALIQNSNQLAMECGNSVGIIFAHYRELVRPAQAKEWFSIMPPETVLTLMPQ